MRTNELFECIECMSEYGTHLHSMAKPFHTEEKQVVHLYKLRKRKALKGSHDG